MILVDSDVIMDSLSGRPDAVAALHTLETQGLAVSTVTIAEVLEGAFGSADSSSHLLTYLHFLSNFATLDVTESVARRFAELRATLRRQGNLIADMDLLIAATAIVHDLSLLTRNTRHFSRVPGLHLQQVSA